MMSAIGAPAATRLLAAIMPVGARRNGMFQKEASPSRKGVRAPGMRSSWKGVFISRSAAVEKAYETASTRNGRPRERSQIAPPIGGAMRRTVNIRAIITLDESDRCSIGLLTFIAPHQPD